MQIEGYGTQNATKDSIKVERQQSAADGTLLELQSERSL